MAELPVRYAVALLAALAACTGTVGDHSSTDRDVSVVEDASAATDAVDVTVRLDAPAVGDRLATDVSPVDVSSIDVPLSDEVEPCFNDPDGTYCGAAIGATVRRDDVYVCRGRRTERIDACANGCEDREGATDACRAPDPCARAMFGNGAYCGAGIGGDAAVLYDCRDGRSASQVRCERGCDPQPPGVADRCVATDPCARATFGNGAYCGAGIGGDAAVLYDCRDGRTASQVRCERGCSPQPPGVPDRCAPPPVTGRCCVLRPPGSFVRGFSGCGRGGSHYGLDSGAGLGTNLVAGISGTVVGVATGNPNCPYNASTGTCPSSCINQFNYVKIRSDCGDPSDGGRDLFVYYLHVDHLAPGIGNGVHVNQGDLIAYVGNSGCSSGPHVHLEMVPAARGGSAVLNTCASVDPTTRYCP